MTTSIGYAALEVIPSLRNAQRSLEGQAAGPLAAAGRTGGRQFGDAAGRSASQSFASRLKSGAKELAAPLASVVGGAALFDFFKGGIDDASGLQEAGTKIAAIFGDAAAQVQAFSATTDTALGQTQLQALDAAAVFGTFGKAAGLAGADLGSFSTDLVGLATDLASFYNTDVNQAIEALGAGLRGESEPLRAYGVLLDDATLRQEALRLGLIKTTKSALTPQQKVLAANAAIYKQTADAQGDFERTSDGLANQQRILSAQFKTLRAEVGAEVLPALTNLVSFGNDKVVPFLRDAGGVAGDAAKLIGGLPGPVKAAAGAFVALKAAQALGVGSTILAGYGRLAGIIDSLRLRVMFARDAYRANEAAATGASTANNKLASSLAAVRAASQGAAAGAGAVLKTALPIAALTAGITLYSKFRQAQENAKAQVEELTASLDKQTGALTANSIEVVKKNLRENGVIDLANKYGVALDDLAAAALGNADAQSRINDVLDAQVDAFAAAREGTGQYQATSDPTLIGIQKLRDAIGDQNGVLNESAREWRENKEITEGASAALDENSRAQGRSVGSTRTLRGALNDYQTSIDDAEGAIRDLMNAEKERNEANLANRRDRLSLFQSIRAARKEGREGKDGLDDETAFGAANVSSLLDVIEQFNGASNKVRNTPGLFKDVRGELVDLVQQMGGSKRDVREYVDLLNVPASASTKFKTPGLREAIRDAETLRSILGTPNLQDGVEIVFGLRAAGPRVPAGVGSPPTAPGFDGGLSGGIGGTGGPQNFGPVYNGPVTYTDDEEGRRAAQRRHRRAGSDGVRRP